MSSYRTFEVVGVKYRDRSKKSWREYVEHDIDLLGLRQEPE